MIENAKIRTKWIDAAKFIAIVGVMADHTWLTLYTEQSIASLSYYSVSLFILMMGITTFWSLKGRKGNLGRNLAGRCWGIFRPYLVASLIYSICLYGSFDLEVYIRHVIRFDASIHLYYVMLFLQLVLVSPLIYRIFNCTTDKKRSLLIEIIGLALIVLLSIVTMNYTNILSIFAGGGKLFGGTYLILFYIGMWFGKYYDRIHLKKWQAALLSIVCLCATALWCGFIVKDRYFIDTYLPFGRGYNPPSISLFVYSILLAATIYAFGMLLNECKNNLLPRIFDGIAWLGRHTLYIYLYHVLFLTEIFDFFKSTLGISIDNIWVKRAVYFGCMIFGSIVIEYVLEKLHKTIREAYVDGNNSI